MLQKASFFGSDLEYFDRFSKNPHLFRGEVKERLMALFKVRHNGTGSKDLGYLQFTWENRKFR